MDLSSAIDKQQVIYQAMEEGKEDIPRTLKPNGVVPCTSEGSEALSGTQRIYQ